ncbi:hypothetical protein GCM10009682_01260 [Luedemannella flava]|uniref:Uncharacterized protein n=1 Tax=Luedemannella flava TaxID=349316 RepID=A0ABN2LBZ0_9ACTN
MPQTQPPPAVSGTPGAFHTVGTTGPVDGEWQGSVKRATALAGLSSVADIAAVAQLLTTGSRIGVLVAGLLSVLAGFLGLVHLHGRPVGRRALLMALLITIGAGTSGAVLDRYWTGGPVTAATGHGGQASGEPTGTGVATPTLMATSGAADTTGAPSTTPAVDPPSKGAVLRTAVVTLQDQDYLDAETGMIGEVRPGADLWWVADGRELWTAVGGKYPITRISAKPDLRGCVAELESHDYDLIEVGQMRAGDWACARSAEGNVIAIQIRAVPGGDAPLTISYTVWQQ